MYQIGELAALSGLTPDTLRYYERIGLLPPPARTSGGFRVYPPQVLDRLRFIKQAQSLGLTLQEIRDLVAYQDHGGLECCRKVRDLLRARLAQLQQKLTELEQFRALLSLHLDECERTLGARRSKRRADKCPVIEALTRSMRPARARAVKLAAARTADTSSAPRPCSRASTSSARRESRRP